ncbi:MAG: o-succinylbenzoate synthase [Gemmatimonadales bacterium]|nr:o-succinylbenzoate synthase [Gemmatimonadales bacterium]
MLRITHLTLREIRLTLKEPFRISSGAAHERRVLLVELRDADGVVGWGECPAGETPHYSPETVDTAWLAIQRWIAPLVVGQRYDAPADLYPTLRGAIRGHHMARAAVEMAAWELTARARDVPLAQLLGGTRERVATGISLGIQARLDQLVSKAQQARQEGYRRIKLKIKPGADIACIEAVRQTLGSDAPLSVDANGAYAPSDTELLQQLDSFDLAMIEQPLAFDDLVRHAVLQRKLATPVCLDESITSPERAADMVILGSGKIINVKPARVGGFTAARAIHDFAAQHDIPVWCGGLLESGIGRAHNVALASLPNFQLPGDLSPSSRYWDRDIVRPEWTMDDGMVTVPWDKPGFGVEVDRERIEQLTVRSMSLP